MVQEDFMTHLCCHLCAVYQEYREIRETSVDINPNANIVEVTPPVQSMDIAVYKCSHGASVVGAYEGDGVPVVDGGPNGVCVKEKADIAGEVPVKDNGDEVGLKDGVPNGVGVEVKAGEGYNPNTIIEFPTVITTHTIGATTIPK
ncbi:hypothetical protein CTI12_AA546960 [Artemisia annua]|uniref:Uncharacterized protein n=1 Tax=Artemisia annua TaxID=35608 RepID=A0A2U1KZN3_ARTAN|nr:hypothetical protein CTI12_AA546960 [Artemisia annua]